MNQDLERLTELYDQMQAGYSPEVYGLLDEFGLLKDAHILDVGCGSGLASEPLYTSGRKVSGVDQSAGVLEFARKRMPDGLFGTANAEELPFPDETFDGAVCGQSFHAFEHRKAIAEMLRVVKPGGVIAIWWKLLHNNSEMNQLRDAIAQQAGYEPLRDFMPKGFRAFYGAQLDGRSLRIVPWSYASTVETFMSFETQQTLGNEQGTKAQAFLALLRRALVEKFGDGKFRASYSHFVYYGKRPAH